jgi:hypothetical protein
MVSDPEAVPRRGFLVYYSATPLHLSQCRGPQLWKNGLLKGARLAGINAQVETRPRQNTLAGLRTNAVLTVVDHLRLE